MPAAPPPLPASPRKLAQNVVEELWFGDDDPIRTHMEASASLAATTAIATGLRPIPVVATQVLALSRNPDASIADVRRAIERDPALAARVLRVANSALYAGKFPFTTLDSAIVRLGMRNVTEVVMGLVAHGMFDRPDAVGRRLRDHSVGVAAIARALAIDWHCLDVEDVFVCGLMHDIGKLLAAQVREIDYAKLATATGGHPDATHVHERQLVGWDHAVLGAHVLVSWRIPQHVATVVAFHHQPGRAYTVGGSAALTVALIRLADVIEYQIQRRREPDAEFISSLARDSALEYVGQTPEQVTASWPRLLAVVDEMRSALA